jgi:hypothetical protein
VRPSRGATNADYLIIVILVALAVLIAYRRYGEHVGQKYDCAALRIDGAPLPAECRSTASATPAPSPSPRRRVTTGDRLVDQPTERVIGDCLPPGVCPPNVTSEGPTLTFTFELTAEDIAAAAATGGLFLQFRARGVDGLGSAVAVDGRTVIPNVRNGVNFALIDAAALGVGQHTVTFTSGSLPNSGLDTIFVGTTTLGFR